MSTTSTNIRIRRIPLEFPADLDPLSIIEGCPEESCAIVGVSLLLPYLEPYLIRSMRAAKEHITDPKLLRDLDAFNGQEGQHYRQHMRFNESMRRHVGALKDIEDEINADYTRFTASKSLRFNLAYAEGFEAFTAALARFSMETHTLDRLHPAARELFLWHLVEELEHRTVAFDVYDHVCGGYFYRLGVGLFAQWHLNRFTIRTTKILCEQDPEAFKKKYGGLEESRARTRPLLRLLLRQFVPKILATYLPWYSPRKMKIPAAVKEAMDRYEAV